MVRPLVYLCVCLVVSTTVLHKTAVALSYEGVTDALIKRVTGQREKLAVISTDHNDVMNHSKYHNYTEMMEMLRTVERRNPDLMTLRELPNRTYEERAVKMVELHGNSSQAGDPPKPAVVIEAGIHAREWISPAVNLWVVDALIQGYRKGDPNITAMLDNSDWYIIPVTNPDGYEFSHKEDRMWRKNRRDIRWYCKGVDLNRNFDVEFSTTDVSNRCWEEIYPGDQPFSEPESFNVKYLVENLQHRLVAYVSVHSYSQVILIPWGYSTDLPKPPNFNETLRIGREMASAMEVRHGKVYRTGQAPDVLGYASSGTSEDWVMKAVPGIFAVGIELRPAAFGNFTFEAFELEEEQIVPTAEEYFDGLVAMAKELQLI
ncbi:Zinc carboxypeptidase [Plakobranchus ocellatus]|uniref:Zinc carboxypeptidase n=1 Tax=Plakobranchus ocellatus TaxID=259542 RepID=A0AAV4AM23_9GAST|nr:Zinc carboxypeptidase [Plakobranchus ocellatus]